MSVDGAIFLSAGVPDARRAPALAASADPVAIVAAVSALVYATLGRRRLVLGGQPAITAVVRATAEDLGVGFGEWVHLYQSEFFRGAYPEENALFETATYVPAVEGDREASLRRMRERMFADHEYHAAVFIGGMVGVVDEYDIFREMRPGAAILPVASTGGATLQIAERAGPVAADLTHDLDYVGLMHRSLGIGGLERRYRSPREQPSDPGDRLGPSQVPGSPPGFAR